LWARGAPLFGGGHKGGVEVSCYHLQKVESRGLNCFPSGSEVRKGKKKKIWKIVVISKGEMARTINQRAIP